MIKDMKDIVSLCKRRGFIFPASDIYGGINGFWDYGPLGTELKNNIRDLWWKAMVLTPPVGPDGQPVQIVGLDSAIIQNPKCWEASGHIGGFNDPMVDCKETKKRYRADHLVAYVISHYMDDDQPELKLIPVFEQNTPEEEILKKFKKLGLGASTENYKVIPFMDIENYHYTNPDNDHGMLHLEEGKSILRLRKDKLVGPDVKIPDTLTEPKQFNLMFHTFVGANATEDDKAYLRPETCAGIFLNFKNIIDTARVKVPFGIAQIGKAFRNEVTPRNFIFRSREFEQMELEWFCEKEDAPQWFEFWVDQRKKWWESIGMDLSKFHFLDVEKADLAHYSDRTIDFEYQFPFAYPDYDELEGIAHRGNFDLTQHQEFSGQKLEYMDPSDNTKRYLPDVIEPSCGLTRAVLGVLSEAYTVDESRPSGVYLNFHPSVAPKKAAILPLTAKEEHVPIATKLYMDLREEFAIDLDVKQNIGKRYARQDEIGTPYCFTVDNQTLEDQTVTVRDRNTMTQERVNMDQVASYLRENLKPAKVMAKKEG